MKKARQEYVTAVNGLEALKIFQAEPLLFKVVFMGMSDNLHPQAAKIPSL